MKTNYKKHILLFFIFFSAAMILSAAAVVTVDPFFQYHKPLKGLCYIIDNQTSQNPGIAKTFDYDSVILGSSMTVNFDTSLFEETMGLHTVKLCYNGAYPKDIDEIMKLVSLYHPDLKEVFLGIDINTYKTPADVTAYELPYYLYDDLLLNDVSYWLNKDVLLDYILKPQMKHENTPLNEIYWSWIHFSYNREISRTICATISCPISNPCRIRGLRYFSRPTASCTGIPAGRTAAFPPSWPEKERSWNCCFPAPMSGSFIFKMILITLRI